MSGANEWWCSECDDIVYTYGAPDLNKPSSMVTPKPNKTLQKKFNETEQQLITIRLLAQRLADFAKVHVSPQKLNRALGSDWKKLLYQTPSKETKISKDIEK